MIVSFGTAIKLKEKGFQQPSFKTGQTWYNEKGETFLITHDSHGHTAFIKINGLKEVWNLSKDADLFNCFYAPSVTELLKPYQHLSYQGFNESMKWVVYRFDKIEDGTCYFAHENPIEAAALAWLNS